MERGARMGFLEARRTHFQEGKRNEMTNARFLFSGASRWRVLFSEEHLGLAAKRAALKGQRDLKLFCKMQELRERSRREKNSDRMATFQKELRRRGAIQKVRKSH